MRPEASPSHPRRRAVVVTTVVALVYAVLACLAYWPVSPLDPRHIVACACGDAIQQAWFLQWVPFALGHGQDPLFTTYLNAPAGANLGVNTSMPLLGLLGWPVTATSSSIAAFNVLLRLGLALSALSMYLVLRHYVRSRSAAFVGGLLFGFSPYMLAEGRLHVFLVFLPLLPPLIPLLDRWLVRADRDPYRCGALLGLLLGLEMLISVELAALFVILAAIALAPIALRHLRLVPSRLPALVRGGVTAAVAGVVVGGYPVYMFLAGPQRPQGPPHSVDNLVGFHADLLSLVVPSTPQLLRPSVPHVDADLFVQGIVHENGFYLGVPLLLVLVVAAVRLRRHPLVLSFATLGVVSFVLGLGIKLTIANHETSVPLPLAAVTGLPALQEIGPTRFALPIQVAASVLLALAIDRGVRRFSLTGVRRAAAVSAVALVTLVPLLPNGLVQSFSLPSASYAAGRAVQSVPAGATTLTYPYPYYSSNVAMTWQLTNDMRFRMPGGEVYVPGPDGHSTNYPHGGLPYALWSVLVQGGPRREVDWTPPSPAPRPHLVHSLRTYLATHHLDAVVVASTGTQGRWVTRLTRAALGAPTTHREGYLIWRLPGSR
ncbi:MAG: hypothetical protein JWR20_368 [Marmoricola sp.]|nr:hypothetical protein [Marmoricola sp.]